MGKLTKELRERLDRLSTTNVSDALDALGLKGSTYGVNKMYEGCEKIIGEAVTMKVVAAGLTKSTTHMGVNAIEVAKEGDVIVIDNGGRIDVNCWGGVLSTGAKYKGVSGVVIDGACRDLDECIEMGFPVYARATICATARGRVMEEATNVMVSFHGVQVRPRRYRHGRHHRRGLHPAGAAGGRGRQGGDAAREGGGHVPRHQVGHVDDGSRQKIQL